MIEKNTVPYNETVVENVEEAHRFTFSDEEIETAAAAMAMSYTYQTSAYNRCCR
jgi:hypothetical protein